MGKVDGSLGRELRSRREAAGHTRETFAAKLDVSEKTIGKWERGLAMPSAVNIRMLEKLGLIEGWLGRNGSGEKEGPQCLSQEEGDRILESLGFPGRELQDRVPSLENANERELVALFRAFSAEVQVIILKVLHLAIANPDRTAGGNRQLNP